MTLSTDIKEQALSLGFCRVGLTTADDFPAFAEELQSRGEPYDHWINNPRNLVAGSSPRGLWPEAKSIIVTAFDYSRTAYPEKLPPLIGRAYLSRSYLPLPDGINGARVRLFKEFLEKNGCVVDADMYLPIRPAAVRAGVASFGRNNFAYVDGVGSLVILYAFVVNKELEYDAPTPKNKCPKNCRACIEACPTQAIYAPFKLNPTRCVGFNNWMRQEGRRSPTMDPVVPVEIRAQLGLRIHGCDVCQEVCPRNQAALKAERPRDEFLERLAADFSLTSVLHLTDEFYRTRVHPIMYNYLPDKKYFQRNAAIALGNTGDQAHAPDLIAELEHPEALVAAHVAWALGKIGGDRARQALEKRLAAETREAVRREITMALEA